MKVEKVEELTTVSAVPPLHDSPAVEPTEEQKKRQMLILLCFYFNVTCSKKKLNRSISIYDAYREKVLKAT